MMARSILMAGAVLLIGSLTAQAQSSGSEKTCTYQRSIKGGSTPVTKEAKEGEIVVKAGGTAEFVCHDGKLVPEELTKIASAFLGAQLLPIVWSLIISNCGA